jgi:hypothetical protein
MHINIIHLYITFLLYTVKEALSQQQAFRPILKGQCHNIPKYLNNSLEQFL